MMFAGPARSFCFTMALVLVSGCNEEAPDTQTQATSPADGCSLFEVVDGDTVRATCRTGTQVRRDSHRLMGFDTPETFRPGCPEERQLGQMATQFLKDRLGAATSIETETHGVDRYSRQLTRLFLDGEDVAAIMISNGLAVAYSGGRRIDWCERLNGA